MAQSQLIGTTTLTLVFDCDLGTTEVEAPDVEFVQNVLKHMDTLVHIIIILCAYMQI